MAEPGSPGAPRNRPRCLPAGGRCCLAQVSGRHGLPRLSDRVSAGAWRGAERARGSWELCIPFSFHLRALSPEQPCGYSLLFSPVVIAGGFLFISFFLFDRGGETLARSGESEFRLRPESRRERQELQVDRNVETAGELCRQTTLLHLPTGEAWLERLLGAGSDARAPCALGAGWGG